MRNFLIVISFSLLFLVGCASTDSMVSASDNFSTVYDEISDVTAVTHEDMKVGFFYNLKDNVSGERENIQLYIHNGRLAMVANYQWSTWLFINGVVFLDDKGNRLAVEDGNRQSDVFSSKVLRESFASFLSIEQTGKLLNILTADKAYCAFTGSEGHTGKMEIKPKVKAAMIATIDRYLSQ